MAKRVLLSSYFVLTVLLTVVNASGNSSCCAPNSYIIKKKNVPPLCLNPVTNETSSIQLSCSTTTFLLYSDSLKFEVDEFNKLIVRTERNLRVEHDAGSFCVGDIRSVKNISRVKPVAIICQNDEITPKTIGEEIYGYCMVISSLLLLITALIYILLPELRDLQGKSIINLCVSLGIGLAILAIMKLASYENMDLCAARGFLAYFFILTSFFWSNAISIQILLSMSRPPVLVYGWKEFIYYALFSWGCPTVLTIIMAIINFMPGDHMKPGIGLNHCWFFDTRQSWIYMYSVMSILIAINIGIFIYTSCLLWRLTFSSTHVKVLRYKFCMTVRLFVVMGIAWIFEMISTVVSSHIIWELLDLVNSLQGVLIFLVLVVFRLRVIKAMRNHGWLNCVSGNVDKWLAEKDDEENFAPHTIALSMNENHETPNHTA